MTQTASSNSVRSRRRGRSFAKLWLLLHGWLALPLWAYVFFVCVTGTLATVSHELVWLADPSVRASNPDGVEDRLGTDALVRAALAQRPGDTLVWVGWPVESHFAPTVSVRDENGQEATLYVNPYDGRVQGEAGTVSFRYFLRALHGWLFLPFTNGYSWGWYAVSILGIPMLGSLVTGILVYKKFWRAYAKPRLRIGKGARIFWGDFHRMAGIWSIPFIAIMSVTAIWFLVEAVLSDVGVTVSTAGVPTVLARESVPQIAQRSDLPPVSLDAAIASARAVHPGMKLESLWMPSNAFAPLEIYGRGSYPLLFESAAINPYDGEVVKIRRLSDYSVVELVTGSMRPLHTGDFLGVWLKVVYFLFGVLLSTMTLSGMLIWTKRTARQTVTVLAERRNARLEPAE